MRVFDSSLIYIYFITSAEQDDTNWEQLLIRGPLKNYNVLSPTIEVRPDRF